MQACAQICAGTKPLYLHIMVIAGLPETVPKRCRVQMRSEFMNKPIRIFLVIFAIIGILHIFFPEYAWWFDHGMPKDVEPSDFGVLATRIAGICAVVFCIFLFFATF